MSSDFLSENNLAGQALLRLVSRGHSVIAELFQLSENIPSVFFMNERDKPRYGNIVFDFKYLSTQDLCEKRIDDSSELTELDEDFRETHIELLGRFYMLFEGIYKYARDFDKYLTDLEEGVYIQLTVESVLLTFEGKQLLSEALYLYGVMLLLLDTYLEGPVRERLMISYYRYKGQQGIDNIDEVCNLLRSTGFNPATPYKRPSDTYPEDFFARYPFKKDLLNMILGRLRSDDIYNQIKAYPNPDHRSTALSSQASMLYVILFFFPNILHKEQAVMREIVDKHFPDNWIIPYYLGNFVDISLIWEPYKAARAALANTLSPSNVKDVLVRHVTRMDKTEKDLAHYMTEGVLTEEYILDNITKVLVCMRESNVIIRWLLLHYKTENKKAKEVLATGPEKGRILQLLLNTAQFEYILKNIFRKLMEGKNERWESSRKQAFERMVELGEYFSGEKPLTRVEKDEQLQKWFFSLSEQIKNLEYKDSTLAGRTIQQLVQALEEVEQFHQIESSLQIKQFLHDTRQCLFVMLRTINIKEEVMIIMSTVADFSYAWKVISDYIPLMQSIIKKDPSSTIKLRSTFLKLASLLEIPCLRIQQCKSPDLVSVSGYYSDRLLDWVRNVLEIVPVSAFEILRDIIDLLTYKIPEPPTRLEKDRLKEFAQLDFRHSLARATHQVSVYADGILAMNKTLVGVIEVDPRKLLEDGLRKQLVLRIAGSLDKSMVFKTGKLPDFEKRLVELAALLDGYKRSFEYISDYVNIYGLKVWQEEFSRIIDFNVEQECNSYLKKKVYDWQSQYQNPAIPIPVFPPVDEDSVNFVGRLSREILLQVDARKSTYVDLMNAWIGPSGAEVIGIRTFSLLRRTIGVFGMNGVNRLLCFMMVRIMRIIVKTIQSEVIASNGKLIQEAAANFEPLTIIPVGVNKTYSTLLDKMKKYIPRFQEFVMGVGQRQLLRRMIVKELNFSCKLDSNVLACSLKDMNSAVLKDVEHHYLSPKDRPYPKVENHLLEELTKYLDAGGFDVPFVKLYVTSDPIDHYPFIVFLVVLSILPKFSFDARLGTLVCSDKKENLDGIPFVVGIITLLKHSHSTNTQKFLAYMGQYIRASINTVGQKNESDLPEETINALLFLEDYCRLSSISRRVVEGYVPAYLFDRFRH